MYKCLKCHNDFKNYFTFKGHYTDFHTKLLTDCKGYCYKRFSGVRLMNDCQTKTLVLALRLMIWLRP